MARSNYLLDDYDEGEDFCPNQFDKPIQKIPYKGILLALVLMFAGSICSILFIMNFFQIYKIYDKQHEPALLTLALLTLVPGVYHVRLAWLAWLNCPGYTYDQFADFD